MTADTQNNRGWLEAEALARLGLLFLDPAAFKHAAKMYAAAGLPEMATLQRIVHPRAATDASLDHSGSVGSLTLSPQDKNTGRCN